MSEPLLEKTGDEALYRMIVESAPDQIFIINRDLCVEFVNRQAASQFSCTAEELAGKRLRDIFPAEVFEWIAADLGRVFNSGAASTSENRLSQRGRQVWLQTTLTPVLDRDGAVARIIGISRDISSHRCFEESIIETSQLYKTLIETSPDAITVTDLKGRIINASRRTAELHGCSEAEILQKTALELIAPEDHERALANLSKTLETGCVRNAEYTLLKKDGTRFLGELNASLIRDTGGAPRAFIAISRDITGHKKTEQALLESERRFKELWDNAPVAYHTVDTQGIITAVNRTEARMLGYYVEEMVGKSVFDFVMPEQRRDARERFQQKIRNQDVSRSENRVYVRRDGSRIFVSIDDVLEYGSEGKVTGVRTTMVNVTERKRAEEELRETVERLNLTMESTIQAMAKIVEMKDPYTAGHQRRVAKLAAAIARENGLPEEQVNSIHMASIIHDIGKIYTPSEILSKPGKLTEIEFGMIKTHPKVSYDILKMVEFPWPIANIVIQHHERLDGSGYPLGLTGENIMLEAKILSVADVVEAIAFHRPYRSAVGIDKALEEVAMNRDILYDGKAVEACLRLFNEKSFAFD